MIVLVAGVSGSGKSTIGSLLAGQLGWVFEDGDALHPAANIAKMHAGVPLTDEDRRPWLLAVGQWMDQQLAAAGSGVIACSALKRSYRDQLRHGRPALRMVFLRVGRETLAARLAARHGHFFRPELLDSQLADAGIPLPSEPCLVVEAGRPASAVVREIVSRLGLAAYGGASQGSEPRDEAEA
ncbi:MAG TPA: gluconokinase [Streptosporangiaceae bacterium]|nr:gluconokinase [Streptosporangiaceae bacterium]